MYTRIGFREVCRIRHYGPPPSPDEGGSNGRVSPLDSEVTTGDLGRCHPRRERAVFRGRLDQGPVRASFPLGTLSSTSRVVTIGLFLTLIGERLVVADWWRPLVAIGFLG